MTIMLMGYINEIVQHNYLILLSHLGYNNVYNVS